MCDISIEQLSKDRYNTALHFLYEIDSSFPVPMSQRVDIPQHLYKLFDVGVVIAAFEGATMCGVLLGYVNDTKLQRAYLATLGVKEEYRSLGIGAQLTAYFEILAKNVQLQYIGVHAHKDNLRALRFYEKNGFCLTPDEHKPYPESVYFTKFIL